MVKEVPDNGLAFGRRLDNVRWVRDLDREGLRHGIEERRVLLHTTKAEERVYIQYPGKETEEPGKRKNELDFRPKLLTREGKLLDDQSFGDVWDALKHGLGDPSRLKLARAVATLLFRMAYMTDFERSGSDVTLETSTFGLGLYAHDPVEKEAAFRPFWRYRPPEAVVERLGRRLGQIGGMSLDGFLHYNQLLAWNEDCKYVGPQEEGSAPQHRKGSNNILTHVRVIGLLTGDVELSTLLYPLSMVGVSLASVGEAKDICRPWLDGMGEVPREETDLGQWLSG